MAETKVRYNIIVSLETAETETNLYIPVQNLIEAAIAEAIQIK
jgi:hypothetical protein